jgi:hypothetical protein
MNPLGESPFTPELLWEREVPCYCGRSLVVTRRDPSKDKYIVCSQGCWDKMLTEGNQEPGSLFREVFRG